VDIYLLQAKEIIMCGFVGVISNSLENLSEDLLLKMSRNIKHRGPDGYGYWATSYIALAHRRLAVQDISLNGHQPMASRNKRYVLVFNGEIYNHFDLRKKLKNNTWVGTSDTETILQCFVEWGLEKAVKQFVGMFAFALLDLQERKIHFVRDRVGEKPLYYGKVNKDFIFSSEISAFRAYPNFSDELDIVSIESFIRKSYISNTKSIFKSIKKVNPGSIVSFDINRREASERKFWDFNEIAKYQRNNEFYGSRQESINELENLLKQSIRGQLISDVPVGCFLSGGIDSSLIAALMSKETKRKIQTFTIGFEDKDFNEAHLAKMVANEISSDHHELYIDNNTLMELIPEIPKVYSEPFGDSSQLPTYLLSKFAKENVTVALSGDGGDELFGGYNRYLFSEKIYFNSMRLNIALKRMIGNFGTSVKPSTIKYFSDFLRLVPEKYRIRNIEDKLFKVSELLLQDSPEEFYEVVTSHIGRKDEIIFHDEENTFCRSAFDDCFISSMMKSDFLDYLPNDILTKVDRASMAVSLETRAPFLDHRIVEYAWSLPIDFKIAKGKGKLPLREILYKYVSKEIIERPKMGFGVPLASWLRGPLLEWSSSLINSNTLKQLDFVNFELINSKWNEHQKGIRNHHNFLWNVLMFVSWLENWKKN